MANVVRGSRLGSLSVEKPRADQEAAPRQAVVYVCPNKHKTTVPFSAEAEIPALWDCRTCGVEALLMDSERPTPKDVKPKRSHWDMLIERRSFEELEVVLAERLALLRGE